MEAGMKSSRTPIAVALTALALAAPAAQAKPGPETNWRAVIAVNAADEQGASAARVEVADSDFDWGSAAVGAGGIVTIALLASLGVGVAGRRGFRTAR
jgi:hypothetical protein